MPKTTNVVLVGLGGYGSFYVNAVLDKAAGRNIKVVGAVDPFADRCKRLADLREAGIPLYDTLEQFYARDTAELVTIATPIHLHCPMVCQALEHDSNVLCEKPLGATIQEARQMIDARDDAGRFVAIGYQWSYSKAVQDLKADIRAGRLGRPKAAKTITLWPRDKTYYGRSGWAGMLRDAQGRWILDSPVNNATAHYLHNMFYLLGPAVDRSAFPVRVTAELYRANPITNYDTGAMRCTTDSGVEICYYASHAVCQTHGPEMIMTLEEATVAFGGRNSRMIATFRNGATKDYGDPFADAENKLWCSVEAARGEKGKVLCPPEAASAQTLCINGMAESMPRIVEFPRDLLRKTGEGEKIVTYVDGLDSALKRCYLEGKVPSEIGSLAWAASGRTVDLRSYNHFPSESYARLAD